MKLNIETTKSIVIAVLVTGIVMFMVGMNYQSYMVNQVHAQAVSLAHQLK